MTGKPCYILEVNQDELWLKLLEINVKKYAAVCSCIKNDYQNEDEFTKMGLFQPHAYYLLRVEEISGNCLLKLKNP